MISVNININHFNVDFKCDIVVKLSPRFTFILYYASICYQGYVYSHKVARQLKKILIFLSHRKIIIIDI